jgi:hypothetical protein
MEVRSSRCMRTLVTQMARRAAPGQDRVERRLAADLSYCGHRPQLHHRGGPDADRRAKLLIYLTLEESLLDAYSQQDELTLRLIEGLRLWVNFLRLSIRARSGDIDYAGNDTQRCTSRALR